MAPITYQKRVSLDFTVEAYNQSEATSIINSLKQQVEKTLPTGVKVAVIGRTQRA